MDETFIVAAGFLGFILLILHYRRPVFGFIFGALDGRSDRIENELSEAIRLRDEAQSMLSNYEKKYREIESEAEALMKSAREAAEDIRRTAREDVKKAVKDRIAAADHKISQSEAMAVQGVQQQAVARALAASEVIISQHLHDEADAKLMDVALKDVRRIAH